MGLFSNYNNAGPGIPKAPQQKTGLFRFVELYGRKMWLLMGLNLIYILACVPVVTFGPATAAMTKIARNYSQERHAFIWQDFWEAFKKNFKQSFIMGLIDLLFIVAFIVAIPFYKMLADQNAMMYIPFMLCLMCIIVFFMMHFYIYLMIVSTTLSLRQILKNSFFLTSIGLKQSLVTLLIWIVVSFLMLMLFPMSLFLLLFWTFGFMCFVTCFNCYPIIRKYVIQPYYDKLGEQNPEFDYLKSSDDAVFEDMGGKEAPVTMDKPKKKKGKRIS